MIMTRMKKMLSKKNLEIKVSEVAVPLTSVKKPPRAAFNFRDLSIVVTKQVNKLSQKNLSGY